MEERINKFEEIVKSSFSKAKEHINELEMENRALKREIVRIKDQINALREEISLNLLPAPVEISSGNKGVLLDPTTTQQQPNNNPTTNKQQPNNNPTTTQQQTNTRQPSFNYEKEAKLVFGEKYDKETLNEFFKMLSMKEFIVFLTLDDLGDKQESVLYSQLSHKLNLAEASIRGHIMSLINKGIPIIKNKINNQRTTLTIDPEFKELGLKDKLLSIYYSMDPYKVKFFD